MTGEYTEACLDTADGDGQAIHCPGCENYEFMVSEMATVGPKDQFGIACGECGAPVAKTTVESMLDEARGQLQK